MNFKKLGIVLAGGGGKGAYQIGVWNALRETGLDRHIAAVAGTSVGGLNGAMMAQTTAITMQTCAARPASRSTSSA